MKTIALLRAKILLALGTTAVVFVVLTFFLASSTQAADGIYKRINFQGKLANLSGTNASNGSYSITFTLYDASSGGTNLWDEVQSVTVTDGIFRVELGSVDTTLGNVNFNTDTLYLGIKVGSDTEMTPRIRFAAVPYAFNAQKVNGLTVTNTSDAPFASTTTLKIGDGKTVVISNGLTFLGTDSTTFTFPSGSGTVVTLDATQTLTNKTVGSTGLTFSGATTDVTTGTNEDFVLSPNGTGKIGFNTTAPLATLDVRYKDATLAIASISGTTSFATLALDNYGNGDLLVASKAGFNRFVIRNDGNVGINKALPTEALDINGNLNVAGGVYKSGGTLGVSGSNSCLTSTGGIVTTIAGSCGGGGGSANFSYWTQASGVLRVDNPTTDLLVGGSATTSARFAVLNVAPGLIPVASISAQDTSNNALTLDGNGNIGTTDRTTLTLGTSTTGSLVLAPGGSTAMYLTAGGNVGIGTTAPIGKLNVQGDAGGKALTILNELGANDIFVASSAGGTRFKIGNSGAVSITPTNAGVGCCAFAVTGLDTSQPVASFTFSTGTSTQQPAFVGTVTNEGLTQIAQAAIFRHNSAGTPQNGYGASFAFQAPSSTTNNQDMGQLSAIWTNVTHANRTSAFTFATVNNGGSLTERMRLDGPGNVGINSTSPLATLDVRYNTATAPVASFSGSNTVAVLAVDNQGSGPIFVASNSGFNRFVITSAGNVGINKSIPTEFLDVIGNVNVAGGVYKSGGTPGVSGSNSCLTTTGGIVTTIAGSCGGGGGSSNFSYWTQASGALYADNPTVDLLIGSSATTSAKFAVLNVAPGLSPIASLSAGTAGGAYITATGTLATTAKQGLTFGTTATGNINIGTDSTARTLTIGNATSTTGVVINTGSGNFAVNTSQLFVQQTDGNIGIGTIGPDQRLDVSAGGTGTQLRLSNGDGVRYADFTTNQAGNLLIAPQGGNATVSGNLQVTAYATVAASLAVGYRNTPMLGPGNAFVSGGIGIGTTTITAGFELDVNGDIVVGAGGTIDTRAAGTLGIGTVTQTGLTVGRTGTTTAINGSTIALNGSGTGNVGIATTNPTGGKLQIVGTATDTLLQLANGAQTSNFTTNQIGNLLITPSAGSATVSGSLQVTKYATIGGSLAIGNVTAPTSQGIINVSDGYQIRGVAGASGSNSCLTTTGGIVTTIAGSCGTGGGGSNWGEAAGLIYPGNVTESLAIGGSASSSAKFMVYSVNSGSGGNAITAGTASTAGALTFSGSTATMNFLNGANLNILSSVGGDAGLSSRLFISGGTGNVGIGTTAPIGKLNISGDAGGVALVKFNELGTNDIFTASSGGTSRFTVQNNGTIKFDSSIYNAACTALETDSSGTLVCGTDATGAGGSASWTIANGATFPNMATVLDVLIGGSSTASAKTKFSATNSGDSFINLTGGNVGIGTSSAREKLTVTGNIRLEAKPVSNTDGTTWTKITSSLPGQIAANGTSGIASISAATVYNGSLYIGTSGRSGANGIAEVYRYNGTSGSWIRINQAPGQFASNTAINGVIAMTVHNGKLYIGTEKPNQGEIYEMNGSGTAFVQRNGVAGAFGSQTNVDGVSSMISHQGRLYIGTKETGGSSLGGSVYVYASGASYNTWNLTHTTNGTPCVNAAVDEVTTMTSFNGSLIFTTRKGYNDRSEVCRLSGGGDAGAVRLNETGNTGNYDVTQGDVTNVASIGAQLVYNNRLLFGMRDTNGGTILGLDNIEVPANLAGFEQYTNATEGTITQGGTAAIDGVTSMAVYNGTLYIGTEENGAAGAGGAEVYKYLGDDKWGRISQSTAGTIASGGTTGVATINKLISWNGKLYAMTSRGGSLSRGVGGAEIYEYTGPELQQSSHALIFHSANSGQSGGEQAGYENIGSIFFNATASAGLNNQGAFIFSHGIVTANGGFDVAEDYPTHDDGLSPGDIVAMSQDDVGFVERAKGAYNEKIIGVYSEKPGFRLAQDKNGFIDGYKAVAVALVGRVPVNVSTENGPIAVGDYLTSSSVPGVAMKATKSGAVIGQAMDAYDGSGVGKILVYVTKGITNGTRLSSMLSGLQVDQVAADGLDHVFGKQILAALLTQRPELERKTDFSEILTDRVAAGLEIVAPKVTAHEVTLDEISIATGSAINVRLGTDGSMVVLGKDDKEVIRFDSDGNAFFAGTLQADKIKANQIDLPADAIAQALQAGGLELLVSSIKYQVLSDASLSALFAQAPSVIASETKQSPNEEIATSGLRPPRNDNNEPVASEILAASIAAEIDQLSTLLTKPDPQPTFSLQSFETGGIATVSGNLRVKGSGFVEGILTVVDTLMTKDLLVSGISQFLGDVVFKEKVEFSKTPLFNTDTAGIAQIHKGHQFVNVAFETPYEDIPVIQTSIISHELTDQEYNDLITDNTCDKTRGKDACQELIDDAVLLNNTRFLLAKKSEKGFTIKLGKNAERDLWFSWTALDVKEKRTIESKPTPTPIK